MNARQAGRLGTAGEVFERLIGQREDDVGEDRIHRAVSEDGTQIAGRVQGQGPPSVLVHGGLGDGEVSWRFMLPSLSIASPAT